MPVVGGSGEMREPLRMPRKDLRLSPLECPHSALSFPSWGYEMLLHSSSKDPLSPPVVKHMALYGCSKMKGRKLFLTLAAMKTRAIIFFTEPKVGARNFLVRDFTLLYFGVRKREDNHQVKYPGLEGALELSGCTLSV